MGVVIVLAGAILACGPHTFIAGTVNEKGRHRGAALLFCA
jgi:hypothetical protein